MKPTARSFRRAASRGFSLIEAIVVVAIIGVLSMFAVSGFVYGSSKAKAKNATFQLAALFSVAQLRAATVARPQYMVLWQNAAGAYGVQLLDYTAGGTPPAWTTMTPGAPATASWLIVDQIRLSTAPVGLSPLATARTLIPALKLLSAFPAPYQAVLWNGSGGASNLAKACSFCADQAGGALGVARFNINGTMDVLTGPSTAGGSFAIEVFRTSTSKPADPRILAFTSPLSTVRVYQ